MSKLFRDTTLETNYDNDENYFTHFNDDINLWNVSNVITRREMFVSASSFNQPLDKWNVSNVTDMLEMFKKASQFNQLLNTWNVCNVIDINRMFLNAPWDKKPLIIAASFVASLALSAANAERPLVSSPRK